MHHPQPSPCCLFHCLDPESSCCPCINYLYTCLHRIYVVSPKGGFACHFVSMRAHSFELLIILSVASFTAALYVHDSFNYDGSLLQICAPHHCSSPRCPNYIANRGDAGSWSISFTCHCHQCVMGSLPWLLPSMAEVSWMVPHHAYTTVQMKEISM